MKLVRWKRFTWDLTKLPPTGVVAPAHYSVRAAGKEDFKATRDVIFSAFSLDAAWSDTLKSFSAMLEGQLEAAFAKSPGLALVVFHGQRIIAASLLALESEAENHLLSGPCVLAEYRNRSIGTTLLWDSLKRLESEGLKRALGVCKEMAPASKFVYRKFGSTSEPCDFEPTPLETK